MIDNPDYQTIGPCCTALDGILKSLKEFKDMRSQIELNVEIVAKEIKRLNDAMFRCNVKAVGSMPEEKEKGRVRAFFGQLINL